MSTHKRDIEDKCPDCDHTMVEYHMKNPYIDDFTSECPECEPGEALRRLNATARAKAREET